MIVIFAAGVWIFFSSLLWIGLVIISLLVICSVLIFSFGCAAYPLEDWRVLKFGAFVAVHLYGHFMFLSVGIILFNKKLLLLLLSIFNFILIFAFIGAWSVCDALEFRSPHYCLLMIWTWLSSRLLMFLLLRAM